MGTRRFCDGCERPIGPVRRNGQTIAIDWHDMQISRQGATTDTWELCSQCKKSVDNFMKTIPHFEAK